MNVEAGDGNRTHITSLEGWNSTTELHPRIYFLSPFPVGFIIILYPRINVNTFFEFFLFFLKKFLWVFSNANSSRKKGESSLELI